MPILTERTTSGFPLSVGTGLALESIFEPTEKVIDSERVIPLKIDIARYDVFAINVQTLIRNIYQSLSVDIQKLVSPNNVLITLLEEIEVIKSLLGGANSKLFVFKDNYDIYHKHLPVFVSLRKPITIPQKIYHALEYSVLEMFSKQNPKCALKQIPSYKVLMLTHIPRDLLYDSKAKLLHLLESHTGKLKIKDTWGSKYYKIPNYDLTYFPFMLELLYLLGDNIMYKPQSLRIRKNIVDLGKEYLWNPSTTISRVKQCLYLSNNLDVNYIRSIL